MSIYSYTVEIKPSHIAWGTYRNPTNRDFIDGESYVKIPSYAAREFNIYRGRRFKAYLSNGSYSMDIKAAGNGPYEEGVQYAKQFEGVGLGACKAFTPWYVSGNAEVGDRVRVDFLDENTVKFTLLK